MPGQSATITYSVKVNTPDTGNKVLANTVVTPPGVSNCPAGSTDPACTVTVPVQIPGIALVKSVAETALSLGETLHYSFVVTNTGNVTLAPVTVAETAFTGTGHRPGNHLPCRRIIAGSGRAGDLHGDICRDPGGRGRGQDHQHRDRDRHPAGRPGCHLTSLERGCAGNPDPGTVVDEDG